MQVYYLRIITCDSSFVNQYDVVRKIVSSFVDQYVMVRKKVGEYIKCTNSDLHKIMHQICIGQEFSVTAMIVLLENNLPSMKSIDRHMVNNGRL